GHRGVRLGRAQQDELGALLAREIDRGREGQLTEEGAIERNQDRLDVHVVALRRSVDCDVHATPGAQGKQRVGGETSGARGARPPRWDGRVPARRGWWRRRSWGAGAPA